MGSKPKLFSGEDRRIEPEHYSNIEITPSEFVKAETCEPEVLTVLHL